jgi:hypothetical protein
LLCIVSNVGVEQTDEQWASSTGGSAQRSSLRERGSARTIVSAALVRLATECGLLPEYPAACEKAGRMIDCFSVVRMAELGLRASAELRLNVGSKVSGC